MSRGGVEVRVGVGVGVGVGVEAGMEAVVVRMLGTHHVHEAET